MPTNQSSGTLPNLVTVPKGYAPLNSDGLGLANLALWHMQRIGNSGMLAAPAEPGTMVTLGTMPNPASTQRRVWLDEPPGSIPFDEQNTIQIPLAPGIDVPVLTMVVPQGYDGVIKWISNNTNHAVPPFDAGELTWKIFINGRPARNFGNIQQEKGTIFQGREISPLRVFSGDQVVYTVNSNGTITAGETVCSLTGYYYPSKGIS